MYGRNRLNICWALCSHTNLSFCKTPCGEPASIDTHLKLIPLINPTSKHTHQKLTALWAHMIKSKLEVCPQSDRLCVVIVNMPKAPPGDVLGDCTPSTALSRAVLVFTSNKTAAGPRDLLHKVASALLLFRLPLVTHLLDFVMCFPLSWKLPGPLERRLPSIIGTLANVCRKNTQLASWPTNQPADQPTNQPAS